MKMLKIAAGAVLLRLDQHSVAIYHLGGRSLARQTVCLAFITSSGKQEESGYRTWLPALGRKAPFPPQISTTIQSPPKDPQVATRNKRTYPAIKQHGGSNDGSLQSTGSADTKVITCFPLLLQHPTFLSIRHRHIVISMSSVVFVRAIVRPGLVGRCSCMFSASLSRLQMLERLVACPLARLLSKTVSLCYQPEQQDSILRRGESLNGEEE